MEFLDHPVCALSVGVRGQRWPEHRKSSVPSKVDRCSLHQTSPCQLASSYWTSSGTLRLSQHR